MEDWQLDFEWLKVRHLVQDAFGRDKLPDLNAILFLIGIQEVGVMKKNFSKEEKQDLMHVAICSLLEEDGYYKFKGRDGEGWPHFENIRPVDVTGVKDQSLLLKRKVINYFKSMDQFSSHFEEE